MKIFPFHQFDGWLDNRAKIKEAEEQWQSLCDYRQAIFESKDESVITSARLSHLQFREERLWKSLVCQRNISLRRAFVLLIVVNPLAWTLTWNQWYLGHTENFQFGVTVLMLCYIVTPIILLYKVAPPPKQQKKTQLIAARSNTPKMRAAEFLLWVLLPREGREAAIGDTNETFEMIVERFGVNKARLWYWSEVAKSAWPLCCYMGKQLGKWCGLGALAEFLRRAF